jgi:hypothetical protein
MMTICSIDSLTLQKARESLADIASTVMKKQIVNLDSILDSGILAEYGGRLFDAFNMAPQMFSFLDATKDSISSFQIQCPILWTYPQVRIDHKVNTKVQAPWHKDSWINVSDRKGVIVWLPLTESGGTIEFASGPSDFRVERNEYWGLEGIGEIPGTVETVAMGEAVVFSAESLHRSHLIDTGQITLQLRYEDLSVTDDYKRPITQKITESVISAQEDYLTKT